MPKALAVETLLNATDVGDLLRYALTGSDWLAVTVALHTVDSYAAAAARQQQRLDRVAVRLRKEMNSFPRRVGGGRRSPIAAFFVEIHFYLTCWNLIRLNLAVVQEKTRFPEVKVAMRRHRAILNAYKTIRDHHEHIDARVSGRERSRMKQPNDFGNSSRSTHSFGGERIDISRNSLARLTAIVEDVRHAVKAGAWNILEASKPDLAKQVLKTYYRTRRDRGIVRAFRKQEGTARYTVT